MTCDCIACKTMAIFKEEDPSGEMSPETIRKMHVVIMDSIVESAGKIKQHIPFIPPAVIKSEATFRHIMSIATALETCLEVLEIAPSGDAH